MKIVNMVFYVLVVFVISGCSSSMTTMDSEFTKKYKDYTFCNLDVEKQDNRTSCGPACFVAVSRSWGVEVNEGVLLEKYVPSASKGYTLRDLKQMATDNKILSFVLTFENNPRQNVVDQISKGRPIICAVDFPANYYWFYDVPLVGNLYRNISCAIGKRLDHFVVLIGFNEDNVLIMDPTFGYSTISWERFDEFWERKVYAVLLCAK